MRCDFSNTELAMIAGFWLFNICAALIVGYWRGQQSKIGY